jgi:F-box protein 9
MSSIPSEVLSYIFRWVVSSELDVRSLEQCARVCRGFYICARDPQLWKMICFKTWGVNIGNLSVNMHWRDMFINRPHVVFNGKK